jgi:multiple sugar transport system substrate-binding protein
MMLAVLAPHGVIAQRQTLEIMVHGSGDYLERTTQFWEAFTNTNPDIRVEIFPGAGGNTPEAKLLVAVAAGVPPDLVRLYSPQEAGAAGLLQDLTPRFQAMPHSIRDDFWPDLIEDMTYNGRLYALPLGTVVSAFYFNGQHFSEKGVAFPNPSWSWEREGTTELKKLSVDLNGDGIIDRWGLGGVEGGSAEVLPFIYAAGSGPLVSPDGKRFTGNSTAMLDALQFLQDLSEVHRVTNLRVSSWTDFAEQRSSSLLWGSFMVGYFPKYPNLEWDFAFRPSFRGNRAANIWGETPYGIATGAKRSDLAWRALEFIASTEGQLLSMNLGWGIPPARRSVTLGPFLQHFRGKNLTSVAETLSSASMYRLRQIPQEVRTLLWNAVFSPVIQGQKAPRQALDEVAPRVAAILEGQ